MKFLLALTLTLPCVAFAENYAECLLAGAKQAKTQPTLGAVFRECNGKYPDQYRGVVVGSGNKKWSPFSQTADQCTIKQTADIAFPQAAYVASKACCCLYGSTQNPCWGNNENMVWLVNSAGQATCHTHETR
jgi:hypothetical protein